MPDAVKPAFLVDTQSDPVAVCIEGRASFQNSACLHDFFTAMIGQKRLRFVLDFQRCTSMDSTFLGVLAGVALELRKHIPPGSLVVCRMGVRNLELVKNLGLHRLMTVDTGETGVTLNAATTSLDCNPARSELESARMVLAAHENLIVADEANRAKFQDVLTFLKNSVNNP
jgi:anti-anti-sigma regulatory factor